MIVRRSHFTFGKKGDKYYEKVLCKQTGEEVYHMLETQIEKIQEHYYRKCLPDATYWAQIKEHEEGEVMIHVDYSENFKNKQQNEIRAGYYCQGQFSLFTVVVYIKEEQDAVCKNYTLVTPEKDHSCKISFGLNNFMISQNCLDYDIHTIKIWSDGCALQFRSQYAFYMLNKFDPAINVHWNYFRANHGKGATGEIGGTVKHAVYSRVLANHVVIKSPREFAEYANSILPHITVKFVDNDSMVLGHHNEWREKTNYIPDTLKVHYVERTISKST